MSHNEVFTTITAILEISARCSWILLTFSSCRLCFAKNCDGNKTSLKTNSGHKRISPEHLFRQEVINPTLYYPSYDYFLDHPVLEASCPSWCHHLKCFPAGLQLQGHMADASMSHSSCRGPKRRRRGTKGSPSNLFAFAADRGHCFMS